MSKCKAVLDSQKVTSLSVKNKKKKEKRSKSVAEKKEE